ncbi:terminase large subunit [Paraburkholderia sp. J67]|uniref:terminase large subunit n=1 Tax=Paraburkholderia sp. J67 TaxID=2805435 RepID=UPI002ABDE972|nr:terminase TerL endonuclease subunit [Paraburkholderia sp. J67]
MVRRTTTKAARGSTSDPVTQYARAVVAGTVVAGPDVRNACKRHLNDLLTAAARDLVWSLDAAMRAIDFFPDVLRLNGGEFEGEAFQLLDWQQFIVGSLFGWLRADGTRRFREAYVEGGKGCGKSPLAAGVGLYMLVADGESRAEVYAAATRREQAMVLFRDAVAMVQQSPALVRAVSMQGREDRVWNLGFRRTGSFFRPIASDESGQSGPRPHCGLIDEVHEHKNGTVINIMRAGKKGRRQPLIFMITNSGFDRTSVCYEQHEYGVRVAGGAIADDAYFAFICSLDEDDDPFKSEDCWVKANPSIGSTIKPDYLREQVHQARGMPSLESTVRRLNFCQWVDAEDPWIDGVLWRGCEVGRPVESGDIELEDANASALERRATEARAALIASMEGKRAFGGLDLSGTRDLTALAVAVRNDDDSVDAFVEFWTPGDTMADRARIDRVPYLAWAGAQFVHAPPGRAVDYGAVVDRLAQINAAMTIDGLAFDPYRIKYFERDLEAAGLEVRLVPHGQGFHRASESGLWMCRSIELVEQLIFDGKLRVAFNPCLRWNVSSAVTETDPKNNRVFNKRKATGRIDGLVALTMAVGLALSDVEEREPEYQMFFF